MREPEPVLVVDLFPVERQHLLTFGAKLREEEWHSPMVCAGWTVKDIALNLLGDDIGRLSRDRDAFDYTTHPRINSWSELVAYLNEMNELWVQATRRMSSRLLCTLLALTGEEIYQYFTSLDLFVPGEPVSWACSAPAPVWLDVAREYTERWVHQQQIRDAVGRPGLKEQRFFAPVLATFVRALPHTFREVDAPDGTLIHFHISGEAGSEGYLLRVQETWKLEKTDELKADGGISLAQKRSWRLLTKGISKDEAIQYATISGNESLARKVFDTVSIIA